MPGMSNEPFELASPISVLERFGETPQFEMFFSALRETNERSFFFADSQKPSMPTIKVGAIHTRQPEQDVRLSPSKSPCAVPDSMAPGMRRSSPADFNRRLGL